MLERVPRVNKVVDDPRHSQHKAMIKAAVIVQKPLIEDILGRKGNIMDVLRSELPFSVSPSWDIPKFAQEVAKAWDATGRGERIKQGLSESFIDTESFDSKLFGLAGVQSTFTMGTLLIKTSALRKQMDRLKLLSDFRNGEITFEKIQEYLQKKNMTLTKLEKTEKGVKVFGEPNLRMVFKDIEAVLSDVRKEFSAHITEIAKRLSVGFNPLIY